MGELCVIGLLGLFFGSSFLMIRLIEQVQWQAGDRK